MRKLLAIWLGKIMAFVSFIGRLGAGSTWPGHIALKTDPQILPSLTRQVKKGVILIAGTNGKTTTAKMIGEILGSSGIIRNEAGANLLNGLVSALLKESDWLGRIRSDWAIFEVDEATLPLLLQEITPRIVVLLNLFRDQLDRYGEVELIADKWLRSFRELKRETTVILNADDPRLAFLGRNLKAKVLYFGLNDQNLFLKKTEHAVDSVYCPQCGKKLKYQGFYYSHLGLWECPECGLKRSQPHLSNVPGGTDLKGVYNRYNTLAAVLVAKTVGLKDQEIKNSLANFQPAFGRQEEFGVKDKKIRLLLSKNPTGFNESLRTLREFPGEKKSVLLVLNDRIPDGRDISWIWDVDFEMMRERGDIGEIIISGDRAYDLGLRMKYLSEMANGKSISNFKFQIEENLKKAIEIGLKETTENETLYVLATYSAMLEVRKIIGGRKIL